MNWLFSKPKHRRSLWWQVIAGVLVGSLFFFVPSLSMRTAFLFAGMGATLLGLADFLPGHRPHVVALVRVIVLVCFSLSIVATLFFLF